MVHSSVLHAGYYAQLLDRCPAVDLQQSHELPKDHPIPAESGTQRRVLQPSLYLPENQIVQVHRVLDQQGNQEGPEPQLRRDQREHPAVRDKRQEGNAPGPRRAEIEAPPVQRKPEDPGEQVGQELWRY